MTNANNIPETQTTGNKVPDDVERNLASMVLISVVGDMLGEDVLASMPRDITDLTDEVASMPILGGLFYNARKGPDEAILEAADWMVDQLSDELKARIVGVFHQHQLGY